MSNGRYEGDFRCEILEGERCFREATMCYRETITPSHTPVIVCPEHADDLEKGDYEFDEQATAQLAKDRERERLIGLNR